MARRSANIEHRRARRPRGFTLAEGLIASTVLAAAVVGIFGPLSATFRQIAVTQENGAATGLAEQLMEEIATKSFADPGDYSTTLGPEKGETPRSGFDNIDDYDQYSDTTTSLGTAAGGSVTWSSGELYSRSVSAEYRQTRSGSPAQSGDFVLVTVKVSGGTGQEVVLQRLMSRYSVTP